MRPGAITRRYPHGIDRRAWLKLFPVISISPNNQTCSANRQPIEVFSRRPKVHKGLAVYRERSPIRRVVQQ